MAISPTPGVTPGYVEDVTPVVDSDESVTTYEVEILRENGEVRELGYDAPIAEIVRPGGTVTNIGAGPVLPANPYEGQVWILT